MEEPQILVLGAGVVGMNAALQIQKDLPEARVTVRADRFSPHTTSDVSAGIFHPDSRFRGPTKELTDFWLMQSWKFYHQLKEAEGAKYNGVIDIPCYTLSKKEEDAHVHFLEKHANVYRRCTQRELDLFLPRGTYSHGTYTHSILTDCSRYLPWAYSKFQSQGGVFDHGRVNSWQQLENRSLDVVVNCTGFGSRQLCGDDKLTASRGQVFKVRAPWIKIGVFAGPSTYVLPGVDLVTVGSTTQLDNMLASPDANDAAAVWSRALRLMPCLAHAEIVSQKVGFRPVRHTPRVEKEEMFGGNLKVVHNYGHGSWGVMSSPGTAITTSTLVQEALVGNMTNTHLRSNAKL